VKREVRYWNKINQKRNISKVRRTDKKQNKEEKEKRVRDAWGQWW